jgi:Flp pilus assembly pilin Flp
MIKRFLKNRNNRKGQGMTEYVLIVFLIAILAYAAVELFGGKIKTAFETGAKKIGTATQSGGK